MWRFYLFIKVRQNIHQQICVKLHRFAYLSKVSKVFSFYALYWMFSAPWTAATFYSLSSQANIETLHCC